MQVKLLASATSGNSPFLYTTNYVVNGTVAFDAGSLGFAASIEEQLRVQHVFLTHSHADHVLSLPLFLENVYQGNVRCVKLYGGAHVLDALQQDIFNYRIWPDFIQLSQLTAPFLELEELKPETPVEVEGLTITPIEVDHTVPTFGYLIDSGEASVALIADTGPTERIWEFVNQAENLRAVFLEASFPNELHGLAEISKHLTPRLFHVELEKLKREVPVIAVHVKPRFHQRVVDELNALGRANVEVGRPGFVYDYS